jgi:hypothetical protein
LKFFGFYKILERVSDVAYRLELPVGAKLHDAFHVGLLKKYYGEVPAGPGVLLVIHHGHACLELTQVSKSRLARGRHELLVH